MLTAAQARANADSALDWHEQQDFDRLMADIDAKSKTKNYVHYVPDNNWFKESMRIKLIAAGYILDKCNGNWRIRW